MDTSGSHDLQYRQVLEKARKFCAWQERCAAEVDRKLRSLGCTEQQRSSILSSLQEDDYLNEKRFAHSFVRGKINQNQWGRIRIKKELEWRGLDKETIQDALSAFDNDAYIVILQGLVRKKLPAGDIREREKTIRYLIGRGFEPDLVIQTINELQTNS